MPSEAYIKAMSHVRGGGKFGDVFGTLPENEHEQFKWWFCYECKPVAASGKRTQQAPRVDQPNPASQYGSLCKCGGFMVRDGKCEKCTSCGASEGSCS